MYVCVQTNQTALVTACVVFEQVTFRDDGPDDAPPSARRKMDSVPEGAPQLGLVVPSFDLAKMPVGGQGRGCVGVL